MDQTKTIMRLMSQVRVAVVGASSMSASYIINSLIYHKFDLGRISLFDSRDKISRGVFQILGRSIQVNPIESLNVLDYDVMLICYHHNSFVKKALLAIDHGVLVAVQNAAGQQEIFDRAMPVVAGINDFKFLQLDSNTMRNPSASAFALSILLYRLSLNQIDHVSVAGYQSLAMTHINGDSILYSAARSLIFEHDNPEAAEAYNVSKLDDDITTSLDLDMILESEIPVSISCFSVPVFVGTGLSITMFSSKSWDIDKVRDEISNRSPGDIEISWFETRNVSLREIKGASYIAVSDAKLDGTRRFLSLWIAFDELFQLSFNLVRSVSAVIGERSINLGLQSLPAEEY